jgi:hypothetical protein
MCVVGLESTGRGPGAPTAAPRGFTPAQRWAAHRCVAALLAVLAGSSAAAAPDTELEYDVKVEFIERFTHFVDWPPELFPSEDTAFVLCAVGQGPLSSRLERLVARGGIKGHPARIRHVGRNGSTDGCHLLYIAPTDPDQAGRILDRTQGKPVLSIGDTPGFAEQGVLINLFLDESSRVRFQINVDAVRASRLRVSAKLMSLARLVDTRR